MAERGETESVQAVKDAMKEGKLEYIVAKGDKNDGAHNGYQYRRFDITKRTLP
ncbi:hypothetical protein [Streptomyces sp. NRRL WC-3549]|uniref:hypothetical protein n=1 Tax=Streptomyces sp. NRRL WC-3549 TaxID=1463925 RepID=UPI00131E2E80|nr:hypothetical protein [Streptomyces sp. NRRL WC-3549]